MSRVSLGAGKVVHAVGNDVSMKQRPVPGQIFLPHGFASLPKPLCDFLHMDCVPDQDGASVARHRAGNAGRRRNTSHPRRSLRETATFSERVEVPRQRTRNPAGRGRHPGCLTRGPDRTAGRQPFRSDRRSAMAMEQGVLDAACQLRASTALAAAIPSKLDFIHQAA